MTNFQTQADQFFKLSIISTITMLEEKTGNNITSFENLNNKTYDELEAYRDNLIKVYNQFFNS